MSTSALPAALAKGRYSVTRLLGEGSEKRVYLGHDTILDRDVAIAVIRTPGVDESRLVRLRREARAMGQLGDHPHVVTVYDVGEEDGQPFIVSQYMAGGTVVSWLVCIAALVETCAFLGDSRRAAILYRLLLPYAPRNIAVATGTISWGPVAYYLGRLAATMGRHDEAEAHFEHALEMSDTMGARPFVARTQHAYATVLAARDERRRALEMLNRALETARELGMNVLVKRTLAEKLRLERVADPMTTIAS